MQGRGKKAIINTFATLLLELVTVVCGFILPRLILHAYGSTYNGITSSITQFLGCAVLLRAGIGGATRAALYKPLATHDRNSINAIMSATNKFMRKIALILGAIIIIFACIYPFLVINEFDWSFTFSLFLIIGISTFAESFFGITNLILLQADQKVYISNIFQIIIYILNVIIAAILIKLGFSIHLVKLGSSLVFALYPIALKMYVKRMYDIDFNVEPDNKAIGQRWDAFWHQVANFVMTNTDTFVLTIFASMSEVSVYSVYNLVLNGLRKLVSNLINGLEAAFGNMIAVGDQNILESNFLIIEYLVYSVSTIIYTCTALLILQFVSAYTNGITDANYLRPAFAYIIILAHFFNCIRQPYQIIVQAAGHYKQTKIGAMIEPVLNIIVSVSSVVKFGLVGVAVGTLVSTIFRTVQYATYVSSNIIPGTMSSMIKKMAISALEIAAAIFIYRSLPLRFANNYLCWLMNAIVAFGIITVIVLVTSIIMYREELSRLIKKIGRII